MSLVKLYHPRFYKDALCNTVFLFLLVSKCLPQFMLYWEVREERRGGGTRANDIICQKKSFHESSLANNKVISKFYIFFALVHMWEMQEMLLLPNVMYKENKGQIHKAKYRY